MKMNNSSDCYIGQPAELQNNLPRLPPRIKPSESIEIMTYILNEILEILVLEKNQMMHLFVIRECRV